MKADDVFHDLSPHHLCIPIITTLYWPTPLSSLVSEYSLLPACHGLSHLPGTVFPSRARSAFSHLMGLPPFVRATQQQTHSHLGSFKPSHLFLSDRTYVLVLLCPIYVFIMLIAYFLSSPHQLEISFKREKICVYNIHQCSLNTWSSAQPWECSAVTAWRDITYTIYISLYL